MEMKVYRVKFDHKCQSLLPVKESMDFVKKIHFQAEMEMNWMSYTFYRRNVIGVKKSDFYYIDPGALVYGDNVYNSPLEEIMERSGEILHASLDDHSDRLHILNVTACFNCFDKSKSKFKTTPDNSVVTQVFKYEFFGDRILDQCLFKIPETRRVDIFALSGRDGPEDEFYAQYTANGFSGLIFEEVWTEDQS